MLLAVVLMVGVVAIVLARGVRDAAADARSETAAAGEAGDLRGMGSVPQTGVEPGSGAGMASSAPVPAGSTAADALAGPSAAQPSGPAPATEDADWWTVLDGLDERRAQAIAHADLGAIGSYAAADSSFSRSEARVLGQLSRDRLRPRGWRTTVIAIEKVAGPRPSDSGRSEVVLTVVDVRSAFELVDEVGTVVRSVPTSAKRRWHITLTRQIGGTPSNSAGPAVEGAGAGRADAAQEQPDVGSGRAATSSVEGLGAPGADQGLDDARSAVADDDTSEQPGGEGEAASGGAPAASKDAPDRASAASPGDESPSAGGVPAQDDQLWRIMSAELLA